MIRKILQKVVLCYEIIACFVKNGHSCGINVPSLGIKSSSVANPSLGQKF